MGIAMKKKRVMFVSILFFVITLAFVAVRFLLPTNHEANWEVELLSSIDATGFYVITNDNHLRIWALLDEYGMPRTIMENVSQVINGSEFLVLTDDGVLWEIIDCYETDLSEINIFDIFLEIDSYEAPERHESFKYVRLMDDVIMASSSQVRGSGAIRADGSLWIWGSPWIRATLAFEADKAEIELALEENPQLLDYEYEGPILLLENVRYVSIGDELAIKNDDSLWVWGMNQSGQIGDGTNTYRIIPVMVLEDVRTAAGSWHRMAIKNDDSLWAWGSNNFGQLGDGTTIDRAMPTHIMDNVRQVSVGSALTMVVKEDNTLWAWGQNWGGHLGDGTTQDRSSPVQIMDNVLYVIAGDSLGSGSSTSPSLAIRTDGSMWAWGFNEDGLMGDGTRINRLRPVRILDNVVYAMTGDFSNAAVQSDGSLWVWGGAYGSYLLFNSNDSRQGSSPTRVMEDVRLSRLALTLISCNRNEGDDATYYDSPYGFIEASDKWMDIDADDVESTTHLDDCPPQFFDFTGFEPLWQELPTPTHPGYTWIIPPIFSHQIWPSDEGFVQGWVNFDTDDPANLNPLLADKHGNVIIPPIFQRLVIHESNEIGIFAVVEYDGLLGTVNLAGEVIVPLIYDYLRVFADYNVAFVRVGTFRDGYYGLVCLITGQEIVQPNTYSSMIFMGGGLTSASIGRGDERRTGFIDITTGEVAIPFDFTSVSGDFSDELVMAWRDDTVGFINRYGETIIPFEPTTQRWSGGILSRFNDGVAVISRGEFFGFIDMEGNYTVPPIYDSFDTFQHTDIGVVIYNDLVFARLNYGLGDLNPRGVVNVRTGEVVVPIIYNHIMHLGDGVLHVVEGRWPYQAHSLIHLNTDEKIPLPDSVQSVLSRGFQDNTEYLILSHYGGGMARIESLINIYGYEIFPPEFNIISHFGEDNLVVAWGGKYWFYAPAYWDIVDITGQSLISERYDSIGSLSPSGLAVINVGGKWREGAMMRFHRHGGYWGFIDGFGQEVIPPVLPFDWVQQSWNDRDRLAFVERDGKHGVIRVH